MIRRWFKKLRRRRELRTPVLFRPAEPPVQKIVWPTGTWRQRRMAEIHRAETNK